MPAADSDSFYFYPVYERVPVELVLESGSQADLIKVDGQAPVTGYIYNAGEKLNVAKLEAQLRVIGDGTLRITASKGTKICGTGTKVELIDNVTGETVEIYYLVVCGDLNGDALCNAVDYSIAGYEAENSSGTWYYKDTVSDVENRRACAALAADVNGDGAFDSADANLIGLYVLENATYGYDFEAHTYTAAEIA